MSSLPVLVFMKEGETLRSQSVEKDISIGRSDGNVIRLDDRAVSRKHAVVRNTEEGVQIERQSEFAPIRLNGIECTRALLKAGDIVDIGPYRMRLDQPKDVPVETSRESPREVLREVPPESARLSTPDPQITEVPQTEVRVPESMPSDIGGDNPFGEFTHTLAIEDSETSDLARPIVADTIGAEAGSADPGTSIFPDGSGAEEISLDIGFESISTGASYDGPEEISGVPIDEDAPTRVLSARSVKARLEIADGVANVTSFPLVKEEISIGRGRECDIVLNDKKSSRKNTILTRDGHRYRVKDLESSNGTYVNGTAIKDVELSADDVIRVGDAEIRFIADSADYEKRKDSFLPVEETIPGPQPSYLPSEGLSPFSNPMSSPPLGVNFGAPYGASATSATPVPNVLPARKGLGGLYEKYFKNFKTLKPMQKVLVILCVGLFLSWYFEDELGLSDTAKPKPVVAQRTINGKAVAPTDFDSLPPEKQAEISESIRKATDFLKLQDFDKAIYEIKTRIYPILPEYANAKEIERYAQEGKRRKDAIEEEVKRKEEEAKLKLRIAELEQVTRDAMTKRDYERAKESFSEILELDPDNLQVTDWKKEIETWMEEQARLAQEKEVQEEINKRAWDTYNEGFALHKAGKFRAAIDLYKKVPELGTSDDNLIRKASTMVKTSLSSIRELLQPHLAKAKEFESAGDLGGAFKEFQAATEVDPPHPEGWAGMDRIRDVLTDRAKILYTEAVIAESYSDFKTAHTKFNEIMKMAPDGSLYFQRAQRKLQSYLNFHLEDTL